MPTTERGGDVFTEEIRRQYEALQARRRQEEVERERAEAIRREVARQVEDELELLEAKRALDELAVELERTGAVLDEAALTELERLVDEVHDDGLDV